MASRIQLRRATTAAWAASNPILAQGELGVVIDGGGGFKIGDGATAWSGLAFQSKTAPTGAIVGTTDAQALTNKDLTDGTNSFPTFNQSTTGNAATATKLGTARNINGVAFDGTAAITVADPTKEPAINVGATSQYWRGDKSFQTLNQDAVPDGTTNKAYTATEKTKLAGVASGATANASDATLENRANHTGTQTASTISDFGSAADARVAVGNAATATKLATARNINGVAFDGSADVTLDAHNDARYEPLEQFAILQSAYTLNGTLAANALQQLLNTTTNGAVTLPVGDYFFECGFSLSSMSASSGSFGFGFGGAATFTQAWGALAEKASNIAFGSAGMSWSTANVANLIAVNTNTNAAALIRGRITVTVAGTVIPQVSLGVPAAAIVGAGSYFRIQSANSTAAFAGAWS